MTQGWASRAWPHRPGPTSTARAGPGAGRLAGTLLGAIGLLALAACAEVELVSHAAKQVQPDPQSRGAGHYKVGNPYEIDGVWYYPEIDYRYRETGIASWYGPKFHGKATANGEVFNQYDLTAAHRTLPLPSMVRVTNLENGRSIVVRVNDRGPFKNGRIIDLSTRGAQLLGFHRDGTAKVLVEILEPESRQLASAAQTRDAADTAPEAVPVVPVHAVALEGGAVDGGLNGSLDSRVNGSHATAALPATAASDAIQSDARPPLIEPEPDGRVTRLPVRDTSIYVQAGAFVRRDNAVRLGARLSVFGSTSITESVKGRQVYYRVRLGPVPSVEDADRLLATLVENGHRDARVVVD